MNQIKTTLRSVQGKITAFVVLVLALSVLSGCAEYKDERGRGDAPVGTFDDSTADIANMPDNFGNVAYKCLPNGDMVYVTSRADVTAGHGLFVVPAHPACAG